jgi:hypothetical protein
MPIFSFADPDGKKYSIEGPDGSTPEQAFEVLQHHLKSGADPNTPSIISGIGRALPRTVDRIVRGASSPESWGAVPVDQQKKSGPEARGAVPVKTPPPGFVLDQQPAHEKNPNEPGIVSGVGRAVARGAPIVGGLLNKADAATDAALSYGLNPLFSEKDQLHGSLGERYHQALDTQNKMDEVFYQEHPVLDTAAELGGGIASTGGIAKTATRDCFSRRSRKFAGC